jgi:CheY-like chemotaxis protein
MPRNRVLAIDNDDDTLEIVAKMLRSWGLEVDAAGGPMEGLRLYDAALDARSDYDLIITDAAMPGMSGVELTGHLRTERGDGHTPIMVLTAFQENVMRIQAEAAGADDVLFKPVDPDGLKKAVFRLLRGRPGQ